MSTKEEQLKEMKESIRSSVKYNLDTLVEEKMKEKGYVEEKDEGDPCWDGYEQRGMKDKDGKKVPNCVKVEEQEDEDDDNMDDEESDSEDDDDVEEEGYKGKKKKK